MAQTLTDENFDNVLSENKVVAVRFSAQWCGPCKMMAPIFDDVAREMHDALLFGEVDIDQSPQFAEKYGVQSIPTVLVFNEGEVVDRMAGAASRSNVASFIARHVA